MRQAARLVLLAALCPCCRTPPVQRAYPPPSAEELEAFVDHRDRAIDTLNGRAKATSWLGGQRMRSTVYALIDRRAGLRFEAEVSLQGTIAILVMQGSQFWFLDLQKNVFQHGSACAGNVGALVGIPLGAAGVASVMIGSGWLRVRPVPDAPDNHHRKPGVVSWDPTLGADVLSVGDRSLSFRKRDGDWDIVAFEAPSAKGRFKLLYEDFETFAVKPLPPLEKGSYRPGRPTSVRLPRVVRFAEDGKSFDSGADIAWKERTLNEVIPPDRFRLDPPPGVRIENVDCSQPPDPSTR